MNKHSTTTLTINTKAIADNYKKLSNVANKSICAAVVKANAYGLGVKKVAPVLQKAGCRDFFVATLDEGIELRRILGVNEDINIYVFHGVANGEESEFIENYLIPVLNTTEQIKYYNEFCRQLEHNNNSQIKPSAIVHIDTGMNRLGIDMRDADVINECDQIDIRYVMSHLACADEVDHSLNYSQLEKIQKFAKTHKISLANSYGVMLGDEYHLDMVRPGMALYGINPKIGSNNPMLKVVSLKSKIIQLREVEAGATVGYGATIEVKKATKIATISVGYADGYFRYLSNKGYGYLNNKKVEVIGRVSMDLITLDVSDIADKDLKIGAEVELLGENVSVDEVAERANTIGYEVLTSLGKRYKRIYE